MNTNSQRVVFSSKSDEWETPKEIYDILNEHFHFTLDPCATKENAKCSKYYTKEQNGLEQNWTNETVFVNPPYTKGQVGIWLQKGVGEICKSGYTQVVFLIPARVDTRWWYNYVVRYADEIIFNRGRIRFSGSKSGAPFPSAVVVFRSLGYKYKDLPTPLTLYGPQVFRKLDISEKTQSEYRWYDGTTGVFDTPKYSYFHERFAKKEK